MEHKFNKYNLGTYHYSLRKRFIALSLVAIIGLSPISMLSNVYATGGESLTSTKATGLVRTIEDRYSVDPDTILINQVGTDLDEHTGSTTVETGGEDDGTDETVVIAKALALEETTAVPVDFGEFLAEEDGFIISVNRDGEWFTTTEFEDGDEVKVELKFNVIVPDGQDYNLICYQLPDGLIKLSKDDSGLVKDGDQVIGAYTITMDGFITIQYNENLTTTENYKGDFYATGFMKAGTGNEDKIITFDEDTMTFQYVDKEEPEVTIQSDLAVKKAITGNHEDGSFTYCVTVSSNNGTGENPINITDKFLTNTSGRWNAEYDKTSFTVKKILKDGTHREVSIDELLKVTNDNDSSFYIENLPALNEDESYEITYKAKPVTDYKNTSANGAIIVANKAEATSGELTRNHTITKKLRGAAIVKNGKYDEKNNKAVWEITIQPGEQDLEGYIVRDTITSDDNTIIPIGAATMVCYRANGKTTEKSITLPYEFKQEDGGYVKYVIRYETDLSGLTPNTDVNVSNKVEVLDTDNDIAFGAGDSLPNINTTTYRVDKEYLAVSGNVYHWKSVITVPKVEDIIKDLLYTDTIDTSLRSTGSHINNAHYTTVQALRDISVVVDNEKVDSKHYSINYHTLGRPWYENKPLADTPRTQDTLQVKKFDIIFDKDYVKLIHNKEIVIEYDTFIDTNKAQANFEYTISNAAQVINSSDSDWATYERTEGLTKEANVHGGYSKDPQSCKYDDLCDENPDLAVMTYRIKFITNAYEKSQLETLHLIDTLPAGASLVQVDGYSFVNNSNGGTGEFHNAHLDREGKNDKNCRASDYLTYTEGADATTGGATLEFNLTDQFFSEYEALKAADGDDNYNYVNPLAFYIEYTIALPAPEDWDGESTKLFLNRLDFGDEYVENEVTVESDEQFVFKFGTRESEETNRINYSVIVNQGAKDLDESGSVLLTDTLSFIGAQEAVAMLDGKNFSVYDYDATKPGGRGSELPKNQYECTTEIKMKGDTTQYIIQLSIPDGRALLVEYTYEIHKINENLVNADFKIRNAVKLQGYGSYDDNTKMEIQLNTSGSTASQQSITLWKVDAENETIFLPGTEFKFEKWADIDHDGTYDWLPALSETGVLKTDEEGRIYMDADDYEACILYRYIETAASEGYELDPTIRYFAYIDNGNRDDVEIPNGVDANGIAFFDQDKIEIKVTNNKAQEKVASAILYKIDEYGVGLSDAMFRVMRVESKDNHTFVEGGYTKTVKSSAKDGKVGEICIENLPWENGVYKITETQAPSDHRLPIDVYWLMEVTLHESEVPEYSYALYEVKVDKTGNYTVGEPRDNNTIINYSEYTLPNTGGLDTVSYLVVGLLLTGSACILQLKQTKLRKGWNKK